MFRLGRYSTAELERILAKARTDAPTFSAGTSSRYRHDRYERRLGSPELFPVAARALRDWAAHTGAGGRVLGDRPVAMDATVVVVFHLGPIDVASPCRISEVVDEPDRWGFAYATLPGHSEEGQETFTVGRRPGGTVFELDVLWRPRELLARLSGPIGLAVQGHVTRRYLDALESRVGQADERPA